MKQIEMTRGSLWKNILLFSLPLMLTQVLEVLFNLSDVAIAGKYAYNTYVALGAVGSTTTLVSLFTGLLIGMGAGVNVAVARWLGIGDEESVEHTTHSSLLLCLGMGIVTCLICVCFAEPMLRLLNTKEDFLPGAVLYLRIYALGLPGMGIYNCGNGILSATGDTKRPLVYLSVAGVLNVILNLVFVIGCRMSAEGVAIASAIAQWVSAGLIFVHLLRRRDACRLELRKLRIHRMAAKRILKSYYISMLYAFLAGAIFGGLMLLLGRQFLYLFASEEAVIDAGMDRLRIMAFSYGFGALMDASIAASRGLGKSIAPTVMVILGSCVFRVIWIYTVFAFFHTVPSLYLLYIFSWVITGIAEFLYFRATYKKCLTSTQLW